MYKHTLLAQPVVSQTITASGASSAFDNLTGDTRRDIVVELALAGPVTGTTPSLTISLQGSVDGVNWSNLGSFSAQTAALAAGVALRLALAGVLEPQLNVSWVVSGTTPSFGGVTVTVLFSDNEG